MVELPEDVKKTVNTPGRIGTLSTVNEEGRPNVAYFGSPSIENDGSLVVALGENRTLKNLRANPHAAFFCVEGGPVTFTTPACRLYLKVKEIHSEGPVLEGKKELIAKNAGPDAAKMMKAAVVFEIQEIRPLMDFSA